jgi:hypothetical protein
MELNKKEIAMAETMTNKDRSAAPSSDRTAQDMRPEVEANRREAQQEAEKTLDREASAAIQQTERAVAAIGEGKIDEAVAAIEQATGKLEILLSRNPATALIPVDKQVSVIDTAPQNVEDIRILKDAADLQFEVNNLPATRTLLDALRSEIRLRIYHLPLTTYPAALQQAARLLDQKRNREASAVLLVALNTLVVIDQVTSIPLPLAREAVNDAQAQAQTDKEKAQQLLQTAEDEFERVMELGYTTNDAEYKTLRDEIKNVRKQLKANEDSTSVFARVKEKLASLVRLQSENKMRSDRHSQPEKAA